MDWRNLVDRQILCAMSEDDRCALDNLQKETPLPKPSNHEDGEDRISAWLVELLESFKISKNHFNYFRKVLGIKRILPKIIAGVVIAI